MPGRCGGCVAAVGLALALAGQAALPDWTPLDEGLLGETQGRVEPDADVEVVSWHVLREARTEVTKARLKIYTARGVERFSRVELPPSPMSDRPMVWARTFRKDGTVLELAPEDVFLDDLITLGRAKLRGRSFTFPGLEPGAVVDWQWVQEPSSAWTAPAQLEYPARRITYELDGVGSARVLHARATFAEMPKQRGLVVTLENMPAWHDEPYRPPAATFRPLVYYGHATTELPQFVRELSNQLHRFSADDLEVTAVIAEAAATLGDEGSSPIDLGIAACEWVRREIGDEQAATEKKGKPGRRRGAGSSRRPPSAQRTLAARRGGPEDKRLLHAALLRARGLDARPARVESRGFLRFDTADPMSASLPGRLVALRAGEQWHFFDVDRDDLPCDMVPWYHEAARAVVADAGDGILTMTQVAPASKTARLLSGQLALAPDGSLEGRVSLKYTGHLAQRLRAQVPEAAAAAEDVADEEADEVEEADAAADDAAEALDEEDATGDRERFVRDQIQERFGAVQVEDLRLDGFDEGGEAVNVTFRLRMEDAAQATRTRLLLRPAVTVSDAQSRFPETARRLPVFFRSPWTEVDSIRIALPEGFELVDPSAPPPIEAGEQLSFSIEYWITRAHELQVRRKLSFGGQQELTFPVESHPALKAVFDAIRDADGHVLVLARAAPEGQP